MKLTIILLTLFVVSGNAQERIKLLNQVPYENLEIRFSTDTFDKYVITERVTNVNDGEIYLIKEKIDTITIKCLEQTESDATYEINESVHTWMRNLYTKEAQKSVNEKIRFPAIKYIKNRITKNGIFPDSCQLSQFTTHHLKNCLRLLKETGNYSDVERYERIIKHVSNCNADQYYYLNQSRNLIALDNYLVPIGNDTLMYEITQLEHFGVKANIAAFKSRNHEGNDIIHLVEFDHQEENKKDWDKIIDLHKENLTDAQILQYKKVRDSVVSYSKATIEIDKNLNMVRYLNKVNRHYVDRSNKKQFRFYNYEIVKLVHNKF